ncbi:hypothetical protein [Rickettsiella endosymbiont of Miltochrista miniata]|uniref:hypothetical protein n=1 Tax=Rickettsiella endosymbiont of Miltochrista miniata TaxID=3066239 RepID=UPI00313EF3C7
MFFKINRFFSHFKKKKISLWKKIPKEKRQKVNSLSYTTLNNQESSKSTQIIEQPNKRLVPYPSETSNYHIENLFKIIYINLIYLNIIYLHHETNKVDFCLQAIQRNPILAHAFQLSYNEFRAKFYNLLVISADQGENFSLALSRQAEFFSILTHLCELLPPPFSALGGVIRLGINEINKKSKTHESKNALKYCITDENFTKIVSLLFSSILVKNLTDKEDLDLSVKKNFSIFWEILKEQAEQFIKKDNFPQNIEQIWAYCFCLFESKLNASNTLPSTQIKSIANTHQLCGTKFFDAKKLPSLPMLPLSTINNISKFWENKTHHGIDTILALREIHPRILPGLVTSD